MNNNLKKLVRLVGVGEEVELGVVVGDKGNKAANPNGDCGPGFTVNTDTPGEWATWVDEHPNHETKKKIVMKSKR